MHAREVFSDRFSVSFLLALAIHAVVLIGIGFVLDINPLRKAAETLDVVLVNWRSETPPEQAEYLAQAAQQGGGESQDAERPSQELSADLPSLADGTMPAQSQKTTPEASAPATETVISEQPDAPPEASVTRAEQPEPVVPSAAELRREVMQVARLQPRQEREQRWHSRLPRRRFISANTREYEFATYMQAWVAKVERVGNLNYPAELKRRKLSGDLLLTVGIHRDGTVESINIQRGSGVSELDQAAVRIVRLAAPYAPLPKAISDQVDVLHITRTWRFSTGNTFE